MEKHKIECADLKKCGEITIQMSIGQKEFFLNCSFCDYTFLQLGDFIQHICEDHMCHFTNPKVEDEVDYSFELQQDIHHDAPFPTTVSNVEDMDDGDEHYPTADSNEEDMDDCDEHFATAYSNENSNDSKSNLHDFEKVEIELDDNQMKNSMDFKELPLMDGYVSEDAEAEDSISENHTEKNDIDNADDVENSEIAAYIKKNYTQKTDSYKGANAEDSEIAAYIEELGLNESFNKNKILAIFKGYEKRPTLWDNDAQLPRDNRRREKEIKNIAEEVGIPTEWESIRKMIGKLSSRLRTELVRKKIYLSKGKIYTPAWYNDLTTFIKPKRKKAEVQPKPLLRKFTTPETILDDEQTIVLAKIYNSLPTLWDETEITYRFSNRRRDALQTLLEKFNKQTGLSLTKYDMECEITRLRKLTCNEKRQKFVCKRQNKIYKPSCTFYNHIAFLETDVSPYECPICEKLLSGTQQYKVHLASHDGSLPFKCHICGHGFKLVTNLTVHLRRHAQDYLYKCEVCDKPCATTTELRTHMRCHTGEKPYVCEICGKKYRSLAELRPHKLRHDKKPLHKCEICNKTFYMRSLMTEHMHVHSEVRDKLCSICEKGFTSNKHLRQHMLIHSSEKKYACKMCGKRFAQYAGLSGHVKSHGTTLIEISSKSVDLAQEDQE